MSSIAYVLVILLSLEIRVHSKAICEEDGMTIDDIKNAEHERRTEQVRRELSSEDGESAEYSNANGVTVKTSVEGGELNSKTSQGEGPSVLKKAMENEGNDQNQKGFLNKSKREICDRILQQLKDLPCDNPVVITCGGEDRMYPCSGQLSESPLRAALSDVDSILSAAEAVPQPLQPQSVLMPSVVPSLSQVSHVQTLPVSSQAMTTNLLPGARILSQDVQPFRSYVSPTRILTAEERREKQKGIFEGLLRFGTVVNHVDSFLTDKSKMIIKGLHRMVQSEEDSRFN